MAKIKFKLILFLLLLLPYYQCTSTDEITKTQDLKDNYPGTGTAPAEKPVDHMQNHYNYYSMGVIEENKGNIIRAIYYFKKAFKIKKASEIAHEISSCYLQLNDRTNAENYIKQAISISPKNLDHRFMLVNIHLLRNKNTEAIKELKKAIEIKNDNYEAYYDIGAIYQDLGNYKQAIHYYNKVLEFDKTHEKSLENLGNIYYNLSEKRKALKYFKEYMKYTGENLETKFIYAYLLSLTGEYDEAIKIYEKVFELLQGNTQLLKEISEIYFLMDDTENCQKYLKLLLPSLRSMEGDLYKAMQALINDNSPYAEELFSKTTHNNKNDLIANYGLYEIYKKDNNLIKLKNILIRLGKIFYNNENYPYAVRFFKEYNKLWPKDSSSYLYLGVVYESQKKHDETIRILKKGLSINRSNRALIFQLAIAYDKNNDKKNAINKLLKCRDIDKNDPDVNNYLAYLYSELDINLKDAKKYIKISLKVNQDNYAYLDTAGWIYYKENNLEKARDYLEKARKNMIKEKKHETVIYEHLIELYKKLGNQEMVEEYKKYMGSDF